MKLMTNEVARAFLYRHLKPDERLKVRAVEASFKPTECLRVSQIIFVLELDLKIQLKTEELEAMQRLWDKFYREVLWKQQQIENERHPKDCPMLKCTCPWNPLDKTKAQELHQWEDYALRHYKPPQVVGRNLEETLSS